ncbi:hypothetical protein EDB85DRAFT_1027981 [Lactarius pseudohatsudake]|nr:hypothetical protein EDB85DRAFT_1027981 [Lactarius pseudohatsudake]
MCRGASRSRPTGSAILRLTSWSSRKWASEQQSATGCHITGEQWARRSCHRAIETRRHYTIVIHLLTQPLLVVKAAALVCEPRCGVLPGTSDAWSLKTANIWNAPCGFSSPVIIGEPISCDVTPQSFSCGIYQEIYSYLLSYQVLNFQSCDFCKPTTRSTFTGTSTGINSLREPSKGLRTAAEINVF